MIAEMNLGNLVVCPDLSDKESDRQVCVDWVISSGILDSLVVCPNTPPRRQVGASRVIASGSLVNVVVYTEPLRQ